MRTIAGYHPLTIAVDLAGIFFIALLLALIHFFVPASMQEQFVFNQSLDRLETLLTAAYLHLSDLHLKNNLTGYVVTALYTYFLCLVVRERRWFWLGMLSFLTVLPIVVNLTSLTFLELVYGGVTLPPSRGFSGVVAGFGGFLAIALLVVVRQQYSRLTTQYVGLFVVLVVLGELLIIYSGKLPVVGGALVLLGITLVGIGVLKQAWPDGIPTGRSEWISRSASVLEVLLVVVVLSGLIYGLFPAELVNNGVVTNIFAHLGGLFWGAVISGWGYRYWRKSQPTH